MRKIFFFQIILLGLTCIFILTLLVNKSYCRQLLPALSVFGKIPIFDKGKIDKSYTLLTPYATKENFDHAGTVYLLDLYGKPVHTWHTEYPGMYAKMKKNGNLLVSLVYPKKFEDQPEGGKTGAIQELDWAGNVVWEYKNPMLHHDFDVLPNGNVIALVWEPIPEDMAKNIQGGIPHSEFKGRIWADAIIEIDKKGKIISKWHGYEHINVNNDIFSPSDRRSVWGYINSLQYIPKDPFLGKEAYLVSVRKLSVVRLISKRTGKIIWESPKGFMNYQHDATYTQKGSILVFDNRLFYEFSVVTEIDPKTNKIIWQFWPGKGSNEQTKFKETIVSGAQRLKNGNTFVVEGTKGHLFEVTPEGKLVWDMISPYEINTQGPWPNNFLFKARRYQEDEIKWPEDLSSSLPITSQSCEVIRGIFN